MKIQPGHVPILYTREEDRRIARILQRIIITMLLAYLVTIVSGLYWSDWTLIRITLVGSLLLGIPYLLLVRGRLRQGALGVILTVLLTVTVIAMAGQGIHDIAIMAYPVIILIASLVLGRRDFFVMSALVVAAMAWLVFGEAGGLFVTAPYLLPQPIDFVVIAVILLVAIMSVDMLAQNVRENMRQAQQEIGQRKLAEDRLRFQSNHDALTGIYNRAFFEEELARLDRTGAFPLSIVMADVDGLKDINDTRGHATGDQLLRGAAEALHTVFRADDVLARIGGDEFAVLLPYTDAAAVSQLLVRVRLRLAEHNARYPDLPVRLSLGVATAQAGGLGEALVMADQRMYADKQRRKAELAGQTAAAQAETHPRGPVQL